MGALVSVIIPTYGGGAFLERAIDSVLSQTYKDIEIIVVDDNGLGTENQVNTALCIKKYEALENFHYICHEVNKNGSAARNTGVKNAKGDFIALLDDDDIFMPDNIEAQMSVLSNLSDEYALTYCSNERYMEDCKVGESHVSASGDILYEVLMHEATIGSSSLLIRRSVWEKLNGFDESFKRHQDWEFTARVCAEYKVQAVDHIGFRRYLEFRNSPKSVEQAKSYRLHYLEKMKPYIGKLDVKQQRKIVVYNRMDIAIQYLKHKKVIHFFREYNEIKPGYLGIKFLFERIKMSITKK